MSILKTRTSPEMSGRWARTSTTVDLRPLVGGDGDFLVGGGDIAGRRLRLAQDVGGGRDRAEQDDPLVAVAVAGVVVADGVGGAVAADEREAGAAQELAALVGLAQEEAAGLGLVDHRRRGRLPGLGRRRRVGGRGEAAGGDLGLAHDVADGIELGELGDAVFTRVGVAGLDRGPALDEGVAGAQEEGAVGVDRLHVDGRRALPFRPVGDGDLAHASRPGCGSTGRPPRRGPWAPPSVSTCSGRP